MKNINSSCINNKFTFICKLIVNKIKRSDHILSFKVNIDIQYIST